MENSKFTGGILGLIGVNLLTFIITFFTFGIATPWAVVIRQKWIINNTIIEGKQLYFDGTGLQLFGSWIKWLFFIIITFGIYSFWVVIKLQDWKTKHTHFVENNNY